MKAAKTFHQQHANIMIMIKSTRLKLNSWQKYDVNKKSSLNAPHPQGLLGSAHSFKKEFLHDMHVSCLLSTAGFLLCFKYLILPQEKMPKAFSQKKMQLKRKKQ